MRCVRSCGCSVPCSIACQRVEAIDWSLSNCVARGPAQVAVRKPHTNTLLDLLLTVMSGMGSPHIYGEQDARTISEESAELDSIATRYLKLCKLKATE